MGGSGWGSGERRSQKSKGRGWGGIGARARLGNDSQGNHREKEPWIPPRVPARFAPWVETLIPKIYIPKNLHPKKSTSPKNLHPKKSAFQKICIPKNPPAQTADELKINELNLQRSRPHLEGKKEENPHYFGGKTHFALVLEPSRSFFALWEGTIPDPRGSSLVLASHGAGLAPGLFMGKYKYKIDKNLQK